MKELDFDELDKAVNSLMGELPKVPESPIDTVSSPVITLPSTESTSEQSNVVSTTPKAAPVKETATTPPPLPSPASRRGGRFMDVVHPSSDMKTIRSSIPSRQGVTITPPSPTLPPEAYVLSENIQTPAAPVEVPSVNEWPDPIALNEDKHAEQPLEESKEVDTNDALVVEAPAITSSFEPLSTPFLPDTKVEKRPLGGSQVLDQAIADELGKVTTNETTVPLLSTPVQPNTSVPKDVPTEPLEQEPSSQPGMESNVKALLPAELASDLVAIEASGAATTEHEPIASNPNPSATTSASIGAGSINLQYKEQPSTGDASHAAIYDTEAAQQPLMHPPKKKTGWLVIVWILLISIVGAGAGVAIWYFGLI